MKVCSKCKIEKLTSEFYFIKKYGDYAAECKLCRNAKQRELHNRKRASLDALKNGPCTDCGISYPPWIMHWDHLPGFEKKRCIGNIYSHSEETILAEIAKCELVCANCHADRTWHRLQEKTV